MLIIILHPAAASASQDEHIKDLFYALSFLFLGHLLLACSFEAGDEDCFVFWFFFARKGGRTPCEWELLCESDKISIVRTGFTPRSSQCEHIECSHRP